MASAREELRQQRWDAQLVGSAGSCNASAPHGLMPPWDQNAPQLVVAAGASSGAPDEVTIPGVLPAASAKELGEGAAPAMFTVFAGRFGDPRNRVLRAMVQDGWSAGFVAFTQPVEATPLGAAWRMAVLLPADLASGAPLGNSLEASRRRYWKQAEQDIGMLLPGAERARNRNALSAVAYGDPALRAAGSPPAVLPSSQQQALPLVVDTEPASTPIPKESGSAAPTTAGSSDNEGSPSYTHWYALGALAVFLIAVVLWMRSRKSEGKR
jgi:hypothetical protein